MVTTIIRALILFAVMAWGGSGGKYETKKLLLPSGKITKWEVVPSERKRQNGTFAVRNFEVQKYRNPETGEIVEDAKGIIVVGREEDLSLLENRGLSVKRVLSGKGGIFLVQVPPTVDKFALIDAINREGKFRAYPNWKRQRTRRAHETLFRHPNVRKDLKR